MCCKYELATPRFVNTVAAPRAQPNPERGRHSLRAGSEATKPFPETENGLYILSGDIL